MDGLNFYEGVPLCEHEVSNIKMHIKMASHTGANLQVSV